MSQPLAIGGSWSEILAAALVGTARTGEAAEALLDVVAAHALRRRAGLPLLDGVVLPPAAPDEERPAVRPPAAARVDDLLAFDAPTRSSGPLRDLPTRLELLTEWLAAAQRADRRLPAELVPALLDAGRRHRAVRPFVAAVGGTRAGWLAAQRPDWRYASTAQTAPAEPSNVWELGGIGQRQRHLTDLRRHDPVAGRALLAAGWDAEPPDDRAALLAALVEGLSPDDEPLLDRALDDRRKEVRLTALDLLARLPQSAYAVRMTARATACVHLDRAGWVTVTPPSACDRSMRRDGVVPRPPGGVGERAWWLEEILARTPLCTWPEPRDLLTRRSTEGWGATLRRGLARAAATQRDGTWAAALVDSLTGEVVARGHPDDRLLLEALYDALPADALADRAGAALARGLAPATTLGVEHVLELCPRPWPSVIVDAVFAALDSGAGSPVPAGWRVTAICELAALRLPADTVDRAAGLVDRLRAASVPGPTVTVVERFAATLRYRDDMLKELA